MLRQQQEPPPLVSNSGRERRYFIDEFLTLFNGRPDWTMVIEACSKKYSSAEAISRLQVLVKPGDAQNIHSQQRWRLHDLQGGAEGTINIKSMLMHNDEHNDIEVPAWELSKSVTV